MQPERRAQVRPSKLDIHRDGLERPGQWVSDGESHQPLQLSGRKDKRTQAPPPVLPTHAMIPRAKGLQEQQCRPDPRRRTSREGPTDEYNNPDPRHASGACPAAVAAIAASLARVSDATVESRPHTRPSIYAARYRRRFSSAPRAGPRSNVEALQGRQSSRPDSPTTTVIHVRSWQHRRDATSRDELKCSTRLPDPPCNSGAGFASGATSSPGPDPPGSRDDLVGAGKPRSESIARS